MNRREFVKSIAATAAVPALPLQSLSASAPAAISNATRFWAIYMTHLHGDVTPKMLSSASGIAPAQAAAARSALIAENVIRPIGFVQKTIATTTTAAKKTTTSATREKLKNAFDAVTDLGDDHETGEETISESPEHGDPREIQNTKDADRS